MNRGLSLLILGLLLTATPAARAVDDYNLQDVSQLTNAAIESMIKTVAIGGSHKAYLSAAPLGHVLGIDLGITADVITIPQEFKDALALSSGSANALNLSVVPLPKISFYKGLPGGFDIGVSYVAYQNVFKSFGAAVRYGIKMPALMGGLDLGTQLSGNYTKIFFLSTHTYSVDFVASRSFLVIEPYVGAGVQFWSGDLTVPVGSGNFQTNVTGQKSGTSPHLYFGLPFKLFVLRLTGQIDYSFAGITTYGAKLAFSF